MAGVEELRGRDLACWCPLDRPCHGDVLLELANGMTTHRRTKGAPMTTTEPADAHYLHDEECPAADRSIDGLVERTGWTGVA